ncbi:MAG: hypothetical protein F4187_04140 [Gemmatimonadetes bacterium]|nr:hypothetical protein [Gemmatimonadota bacterium]
MKTWTNTLTLAAVAASLTLTGCADDDPGSMIGAEEPETFDAETLYVIAPVGGTPPQPGDVAWANAVHCCFLQFDSEEAKRALAEGLAEDAVNELAALSAASTAHVWDNKLPVHVMGSAPSGRRTLIHSYNFDPSEWMVEAQRRTARVPKQPPRKEVQR